MRKYILVGFLAMVFSGTQGLSAQDTDTKVPSTQGMLLVGYSFGTLSDEVVSGSYGEFILGDTFFIGGEGLNFVWGFSMQVQANQSGLVDGTVSFSFLGTGGRVHLGMGWRPVITQGWSLPTSIQVLVALHSFNSGDSSRIFLGAGLMGSTAALYKINESVGFHFGVQADLLFVDLAKSTGLGNKAFKNGVGITPNFGLAMSY